MQVPYFIVRTCTDYLLCYNYNIFNGIKQQFQNNEKENDIMSKNIVILNGSPRRKGNTSALVKAFADGAESSGNKVTEFFLDGMNIY